MPPRGSTLKQARERVYDTGQRFPTDPGSWNPGDAARHARYLTGWANMNLRYRNGNPNGHDAYPKGTVFPRTGPVPQGIVVEPRDVRHGEPYTEGHPALPVIGSHANLDDVYKDAATLGQRLENEYRLRFVRMLGWGGMGAVALFDTRFKPNPAQDDTTYSFFAIKFPLRRGNKEDRDFRREKKYMAVSLLPSFPTLLGSRVPVLMHKAGAFPEIQTVPSHRPDHRTARRQGQGQSACAPQRAHRQVPAEQQGNSGRVAGQAVQENQGRESRRRTACHFTPSEPESRPRPSTRGFQRAEGSEKGHSPSGA